ncbi:MAG: hypothetical protein F4125_00260, partial [Acidimicrobiaceae bacterium]|nr:hypothetical protein [Acidimicrobiaceae bacterium]
MKSRGSNHMIGHRVVALVVFLGLVAAACGIDDPLPEAVPEDADVTDVSNEPSESTGSDDVDEANPSADDDTTSAEVSPFGPAPASPSGPLDPALEADLNTLFDSLRTNTDLESIDRVGVSGDPRAAWLLTDIIRFVRIGEILERTSNAWESLTDVSIPANESPRGFTTNHMIAWDVPAPPGYINWKRQLFELVEPRWAPLFDDPEATVDWRWVSWGGVYIDDRAIGQTNFGCPQGCIPALNDPALTPAADGSWYPDDSIVFGVVEGD